MLRPSDALHAQRLAQAVGVALATGNQTVSTAESCTGGLVAAAISTVAGCSAWFHQGTVCYSNAAKTQLLGVPEAVLVAHGAVSGEVAAAMAQGAQRISHSDWALSVTGVAGPAGGSPEKPVGTVYFGLAHRDAAGTIQVHAVAQFFKPSADTLLRGDSRAAIRQHAVQFALQWLLDEVTQAALKTEAYSAER